MSYTLSQIATRLSGHYFDSESSLDVTKLKQALKKMSNPKKPNKIEEAFDWTEIRLNNEFFYDPLHAEIEQQLLTDLNKNRTYMFLITKQSQTKKQIIKETLKVLYPYSTYRFEECNVLIRILFNTQLTNLEKIYLIWHHPEKIPIKFATKASFELIKPFFFLANTELSQEINLLDSLKEIYFAKKNWLKNQPFLFDKYLELENGWQANQVYNCFADTVIQACWPEHWNFHFTYVSENLIYLNEGLKYLIDRKVGKAKVRYDPQIEIDRQIKIMQNVLHELLTTEKQDKSPIHSKIPNWYSRQPLDIVKKIRV